jgi:hypothetical protein
MRASLVVVLCCCLGVISAGAQGTTTDEAAVKEVVRRYVDGRDNVVKGSLASSQANPGARQITIEHVRFIASGVAVADGRYEIAGTAGAAARRMRTMFVMVRSAGASDWLIAAIRNMAPTEPAR